MQPKFEAVFGVFHRYFAIFNGLEPLENRHFAEDLPSQAPFVCNTANSHDQLPFAFIDSAPHIQPTIRTYNSYRTTSFVDYRNIPLCLFL